MSHRSFCCACFFFAHLKNPLFHSHISFITSFDYLGSAFCNRLYGSEAMFVLITYDVNTQDAAGRKRLRHVAKQCVNYGIRVQNSVFECVADPSKILELKHKLMKEIDPEKDSLRFYYLGNKSKTKVEHLGAKETIDVEKPLIF